MTAQLSELSNLANQLNQRTEEVNTYIAAVSDALASMNIGAEIWLTKNYLSSGDYNTVETDGDSNAPVVGEPAIRWYTIEQLGFDKVEDRWQLAFRGAIVEEYIDGYSGREAKRVVNPGTPRPLLKASRDIRISGMGLVDALTDQIRESIKASLETITKASESAKPPKA